jgi:hypothetical protein
MYPGSAEQAARGQEQLFLGCFACCLRQSIPPVTTVPW